MSLTGKWEYIQGGHYTVAHEFHRMNLWCLLNIHLTVSICAVEVRDPPAAAQPCPVKKG